MTYCPKCGNRGSNNDRVCGHCGTWLVKEETLSARKYSASEPTLPSEPRPETAVKPEKKKKKILLPIIIVCAVLASVGVLFLTHVICLNHKWEDATCTEPKRCRYCQKTEGEALGHKYEEATCTKPQICSVCEGETGSPAGHEWEAATCTEPKTCAICGQQEGETADHVWQEATCTEPKICTQCSATEGEALGHTEGEWVETQEASLIEGGTEELRCSVCEEGLDTRRTEKKDPEVEGIAFNFTDEELIEWINDSLDSVQIEEEKVEGMELEKGRTAYVIEREGKVGVLMLAHGNDQEDGNVSAIMIYFEESKETALAIAAVLGEAIDSRFTAQTGALKVMGGDIYVNGGMVLAFIDDDIAVLATEAYIVSLA